MRNMTKILVLLLAFAMVFGMAACQSDDSTTGGGDGDEPEAMAFDEFVTITNYSMGNANTSGQQEIVTEAWNEILMDRGLNAEMEVVWIEWADWQTKYKLTVASGDPEIDLIHSSSTWLELWENAQQGAFLPLDDLLPTYMPITWAAITPEEWDQCKYEGEIYTVPENNYTQYVNHGLYYRGDWASEFGITEPITDFEMMGEYFQGIVDNKENVVPWDVDSASNLYSAFVNVYTSYIQTNVATGRHRLVYGESAENPYTLVNPVETSTFMDYAMMMDEWGAAGYWREDVLNYQGDSREGMKAGTSGSDQHHVQTYRFLKGQMEEAQPGSDLQMFMFCSGPSQNLMAEPITHGGTSVVSGSANPERALAILELIRTDAEFYRTFVFGIEGVQYEVDDEGFKSEPEGYDESTDAWASNWWGGRMDEFEYPTREEWPGIYDMWADLDAQVEPFPYGNFVIDKTNIDAELTAIGQVTEQYAPAIDFGKTGDPAAAVEEYRAQLKAAGIDDVMAELQTQMDAYKATKE